MMLRVFEAFSGIGTQRMALERLGIHHQVIGLSEINSFQEATRAQINEIIKNGKPVNRNITSTNNSEDKETNTYKSNNKNLNKRK